MFTPVITAAEKSFPGATAKQRFTIIVDEERIGRGPVITSSLRLPNGVVGAAHRQRLTASGGKPPYTWLVIAGNIPAGLELDSPGGVISGNPTTEGRAVFTVQVADDAGDTEISDLALTIELKKGTEPVHSPARASASR